MNDHRVYIVESAEQYTEELSRMLGLGIDSEEFYDELNSFLLEQVVFVDPTDSDRWRVEFLLAYGGPTVRVTVDSRWQCAEFFHSWGMGSNGEDRLHIDMSPHQSEPWAILAEDTVELYR